MDLFNYIYDEWLWSEKFWLPKNLTWKYMDDVEANENIRIARPRDLMAALPIAILLFVLRILWERLIALPLGRYLKIKETVISRPAHNDTLEKFYKQSKRVPSYKNVEELSKKTSLTARDIQRWWRRRRNHDKPSEIVRWKETSWRFIYYFLAFWCGLYIHLGKPWFWDTRHCWYGYPHQNVSAEVYWYYMIQLGFYVSLVFSLFTDIRRKDFIEMIVHHIATILLVVCSWNSSMVRAGTLILVLHDTVDYWMEGAKLLSYSGYQKLCDVCFVIFTILWFITRIILLPTKLLYTTSVEVWEISGIGTMWYLSFPFLVTLQVLHVIWFYTIIKMLYFYIIKGKVEKDDRSASEAEGSDDDLQAEGDIDKTASNNNMNSKEEQLCNGNMQKKPSSGGVYKREK